MSGAPVQMTKSPLRSRNIDVFGVGVPRSQRLFREWMYRRFSFSQFILTGHLKKIIIRGIFKVSTSG